MVGLQLFCPSGYRRGCQNDLRRAGTILLCFKGLRIRTGAGSVQRLREKGRRENARCCVCQPRSPEVRARTAWFLGVSTPHPRAENIRLGGNGGGRATENQRSLGRKRLRLLSGHRLVVMSKSIGVLGADGKKDRPLPPLRHPDLGIRHPRGEVCAMGATMQGRRSVSHLPLARCASSMFECRRQIDRL
jgi:hypothetical protein